MSPWAEEEERTLKDEFGKDKDGKRIMAPKEVHIPIPGTGECVRLPGKNDFANVIQLSILR